MSTMLGRGVLNWNRYERIGDRYGAIWLYREPMTEAFNPNANTERHPWPALPAGRGRLVAEVLEARESPHIGDIARGLFPHTPKVGERILLGEGTLFLEDYDGKEGGCPALGLRPDEDRDYDWMDSKALYRCHNQTVALTFEPTP